VPLVSSATDPRPEKQEKQPASDDIIEVAPGVLRMQLPISLPGLGHVNCYVLTDADGITVVDPGLPGPQSWKALKQRLAATGNKVADIRRVVVTHSHPDHFGGAGTIRHESGADIITHETFRTWFDPTEEEGEADDAADEAGDPVRATSPFGRTVPWGGATFKPPIKRRLRYRMMRTLGKKFMRPPTPTVRLADAERISIGGHEWVAMHTPGHTPDHLCLYAPDAGVVLSGDHVLPTITPHISGLSAGADPLDAFFASLDRMAELDGITQVLPAHGQPFTDLAGRANAIKDHHQERLATLREATARIGPATVTALSKELFRPKSWGQMAESETYAHLEHLRHAGEATSKWDEDNLLFEISPEVAETI